MTIFYLLTYKELRPEKNCQQFYQKPVEPTEKYECCLQNVVNEPNELKYQNSISDQLDEEEKLKNKNGILFDKIQRKNVLPLCIFDSWIFKARDC